MAQAVLLPKLGQTVEEATLVKWHKKEGDTVNKGDVLFEIETDKAVLEAESFFEGTLLKRIVKEGETAPVQSVAGYIGAPGEKIPDAPPPPPKASAPKPAPKAEAAPAEAPRAPAREPVTPSPAPAAVAAAPVPPPAPVSARLFISPRARGLARTRVIDPARVTGTGPNGRIVVKDIEAYLDAHQYNDLRITPAAKRLASKEGIDILTVRGTAVSGRIQVADVERSIAAQPKPLSKMRQVIARRLTQSFTTTPHFYVTVGVDMKDLLTFRQELKAVGKAFSVTDFILEAVILTLEEMPVVNSVCDGETIRWHENVDLGMAVGLDEGLVVPVIRQSQSLGMEELHDTVKDLGTRARSGRLLPDDMIGSTFTVSNMGMFNVDNFHAIINPGEAAILAVASTRDTVVSRGGKIEVRPIMNMTLSVDHRIVDGTVGAQFVNAVKAKLEDLELWKLLTSS